MTTERNRSRFVRIFSASAERRVTFLAIGYAVLASLVIPANQPIYVLNAIVGVGALALGATLTERSTSIDEAWRGLRAAVIFMAFVPFFVYGYGSLETWVVAPAVGIALLIGAMTRSPGAVPRATMWIGTTVVVSFVLWLGVYAIYVLETPEIDVIKLHDSAAEEIGAGRNPYRYASAPHDGPWTEVQPQWTAGYAYPPSTMLTYAASSAGFGDSRWASVIAVVACTVIVARPWRRDAQMRSRIDLMAAAAIGLQFGNLYVFFNGWTEPLALPLVALALAWWHSRSTFSSVMLGLLLSTKQYFLVVGVVILLLRDSNRWKRLGIAAAVSVGVSLPIILWDVPAFVESAVTAVLSIPPRLDSLNLLAYGLEVPGWAAAVVVIAVAIGLSRKVKGPGTFAASSAAVLGLQFLVGYAAFANYWYLVSGLAALAIWSDDEWVDCPVDATDSSVSRSMS